MSVPMMKAASVTLRVAPTAACLAFGAPPIIPKAFSFIGCGLWALYAEQFLEPTFDYSRKVYGMERIGPSDFGFIVAKPQMNVIRCMKLKKLSDESSLEDLRVHLVREICKYPRFRSHFTSVLNMAYFTEVKDDAKFWDAVQVLPGEMNEQEVLKLMAAEQDIEFGEFDAHFGVRLVKAKEDGGVYVVYKNHHALADGMSMLMILSKAQDGGEAEHQRNGLKIAPRQQFSRWEILADSSRIMGVLKELGSEVIERKSAIRTEGDPKYGDSRRIYTSDLMSFEQIRQQRVKCGATFNEFLFASILRAVDEHSGGKELNEKLNTFAAISLHEPHESGPNFQPTNSVTAQATPITIKANLEDTVLSVREKLTMARDQKLGQAGKSVGWYFSYLAQVLPKEKFFQQLMGFYRKLHFISSNMAGPKEPWKFHGGELEYFLIGLPCLGPPMLGIATVGDNVKLTMVCDEATAPENPELFLARIQANLTGVEITTK